MKRTMVLKGASAKVQGEGKITVRLSFEVEVSADMARDIILESGDLLDKVVTCDVQLVQGSMNFKK